LPPSSGEQAQLAAHAVEGAPYHAYHAERRERAARIIQGYLQRGLDEAAASSWAAAEAAGGAHDGADTEERDGAQYGGAQYGASANGAALHERRGEHHVALPVYDAHEVHLLRTVQRAFRTLTPNPEP
jgi:hypothetical protein